MSFMSLRYRHFHLNNIKKLQVLNYLDKGFYLGVLILFSVINVKGQISNKLENLKSQASIMASSFLHGDYSVYTNYMYPAIIKSMGGQLKTQQAIEKMVQGLQQRGMIMTNITLDNPYSLLSVNKELQSTIAQHTQIIMTDGKYIETTILIAISTDDGNHWTFIDTAGKDLNTLRKAFPSLSPSLKIAPVTPPVKVDN
ncbi:hypothetical protein [Pinibacter aurantiacus]|uniref:Uncharacterized protein n=1 Tax=Pinibacter aurantiacus TaxID=2851599 RepID=A0A9E2SD47_9BACT|nr:hypothetical protein [Pinibacter aurantiacus]MBV4359098.1 hypothetical protein [Pinibacter aurantiacus]